MTVAVQAQQQGAANQLADSVGALEASNQNRGFLPWKEHAVYALAKEL
jgi:hypothetical protein|tara:strand:+ start:37 stop:180 length:144 start_codon:yes stop_codon:yes gene_type:complete